MATVTEILQGYQAQTTRATSTAGFMARWLNLDGYQATQEDLTQAIQAGDTRAALAVAFLAGWIAGSDGDTLPENEMIADFVRDYEAAKKESALPW